MIWKRFEDELPKLDHPILILMETIIDKDQYIHWISSGRFTLRDGLIIHAKKEDLYPSLPFKWAPMVELPCESKTKVSLR